MDSWSEKQIKMMRAGGNQKLIDWFESHGVTSDQRIAKKYHSPAAELFRERCERLLSLCVTVRVAFLARTQDGWKKAKGR